MCANVAKHALLKASTHIIARNHAADATISTYPQSTVLSSELVRGRDIARYATFVRQKHELRAKEGFVDGLVLAGRPGSKCRSPVYALRRSESRLDYRIVTNDHRNHRMLSPLAMPSLTRLSGGGVDMFCAIEGWGELLGNVSMAERLNAT
jgi:hypothetical protein